jgi:hypothetical protein
MITRYISENNFEKFRIFLGSKYFLLYSCGLILLFSIFINSLTDIGTDTGIYLDIGEKIAKGGKYYDQIFESNLPYNFYIYALQYRISQFTGINVIILAEIFIYLLFFVSFFGSLRILKKTTISDNKIFLNLFLVVFAFGFFLRVPSIYLNEMGTKTTFFMLLFFPYLVYSLELKQELTRKDLVFRGILMGLIPCFKPQYLIMVIGIELFKFFENKSLKFIFRFDHLIMGLVGLLMLDWMIFFEKEYFQFMVPMWKKTYLPYSDLKILFERTFYLHFHSFNVVGIFIIYLSRAKNITYNLKLITAILIFMIIMINTEALMSADQVANLYLVIFFFCLFVLFDRSFIKLINVSNNKFITLSLILITIFDHESVQIVIFGKFSVIWFFTIITPLALIYFYKRKQLNLKDFLIFSVLYLFYILINYILIKINSDYLVISQIIFFILVCFFYEKKINFKRSNFFSTPSILFILSAIIMIIVNSLDPIFLVFKEDNDFASPFNYSDKIYYYVKKYAPNKNDQIMFFSQNSIKYPLYNYLEKNSKIKSSTNFLNSNIHIKKNDQSKSLIPVNNDYEIHFINQYFYQQNIDSFKDESYKLLIIDNDNFCINSPTHTLLLNRVFKKLLLDNFEYVDTIYVLKNTRDNDQIKEIKINNNSKKIINKKMIINQIEIYARKTKKIKSKN